jgi:hypothetical protein
LDSANGNAFFRIPPMLLVALAYLIPAYLFGKNQSFSQKILSNNTNDNFFSLVYFFIILLTLLSNRFGLFTRVYYYFTIFLILAPNRLYPEPILILPQKVIGTNSGVLILPYPNNEQRSPIHFDCRSLCYIAISLGIFIASIVSDKGLYGAGDYHFSFVLN